MIAQQPGTTILERKIGKRGLTLRFIITVLGTAEHAERSKFKIKTKSGSPFSGVAGAA